MDNDILVTIGISAALIPSLGSVIKNTIDNFRGPFELDGKQCVVICYTLSMFLSFIFLAMTITNFSFLALGGYVLKSLATGWLMANWAGALSNGQTVAKQQIVEAKQERRNDVSSLVDNRGEPISRH